VRLRCDWYSSAITGRKQQACNTCCLRQAKHALLTVGGLLPCAVGGVHLWPGGRDLVPLVVRGVQVGPPVLGV
jgi:hypothetical protein